MRLMSLGSCSRVAVLFAVASTVFGGAVDLPAPAPMVFPGKTWSRTQPESEGFDSTRLQAAVDYLTEKAGKDGARELLIVRRGRIVWEGDNVDRVHGIWSCTKSVTSTVLGLLIDDHKVTLDTLAAQILPVLNKHYPLVTLKHFTTMTSGYSAAGDEARSDGYAHGPSHTPFTPGESRFQPGGRFEYWDSAMNEMANLLTCVAGEPISELFRRRIADPIGIDAQQWRWEDFMTGDGTRVSGGAGNWKMLHTSAREFARLGLLFLNQGNWNGRQLISRDWVRAATAPQVPSSLPGFRGGYGFNWWCNDTGPDRSRKWPQAPISTYAASGYNNNDLFVIPEWEMIIVRLGLDQSDRQISDLEYGEFLARIGQAFIVPPSPAAEETGDSVFVEAEDFIRQTADEKRRWYVTDVRTSAVVPEDGDPNHADTASRGCYVEILPDTRRTHADKLLPGVNFSNVPGEIAVLEYLVWFNNLGRYYVWVSAFSTGTEDNGLHVGLDDEWPESGSRMQWCEGKDRWTWASAQRTDENHCGEPHRIYFDVSSRGIHTVRFSMREDGFEMDRWFLTQELLETGPAGTAPAPAP